MAKMASITGDHGTPSSHAGADRIDPVKMIGTRIAYTIVGAATGAAAVALTAALIYS